jgi:hypothetical protein
MLVPIQQTARHQAMLTAMKTSDLITACVCSPLRSSNQSLTSATRFRRGVECPSCMGVMGNCISQDWGSYLWAVLMWLSFCFSRRRVPIRRSNPTAASSVCSGKARGLLSVLWILRGDCPLLAVLTIVLTFFRFTKCNVLVLFSDNV